MKVWFRGLWATVSHSIPCCGMWDDWSHSTSSLIYSQALSSSDELKGGTQLRGRLMCGVSSHLAFGNQDLITLLPLCHLADTLHPLWHFLLSLFPATFIPVRWHWSCHDHEHDICFSCQRFQENLKVEVKFKWSHVSTEAMTYVTVTQVALWSCFPVSVYLIENMRKPKWHLCWAHLFYTHNPLFKLCWLFVYQHRSNLKHVSTLSKYDLHIIWRKKLMLSKARPWQAWRTIPED